MKKIILFIMLLTLSATSFSQPAANKAAAVKTDYLLKNKHQKTAATILLVGGASCVLVVPFVWGISTKNGGGFPIIAGIFAAGLIAMPASIPFFIMAHSNKKKSMRLSFKNETVPQIQKSNFVYKSVPSLTLRISL